MSRRSRTERERLETEFRAQLTAMAAALRSNEQAREHAHAQFSELAGERHVDVATHLKALSDVCTQSFGDIAAHLGALDQRTQATQALFSRVQDLTSMVADLQAVVAAFDERLHAIQTLTSRVYELNHDWSRQVNEMRGESDYELAFEESRPLISVYIPTWNRSDLLVERSLASVLRQTYDNWEAIVIGDACTDDTATRIAALGDPRIFFENRDVRGPYPDSPGQLWQVCGTPGIRRAFQLAKGRWIALQDDDDEWDDDHLEVLLAEAIRSRAEIVYGKWRWIDAKSGRPIGNFGSWPPRLTQITFQAAIQHGHLRRFPPDPNAYLADEPVDWNRARRLLDAGVRFAFLDREVSTIFISAKTEAHQISLDNLLQARTTSD